MAVKMNINTFPQVSLGICLFGVLLLGACGKTQEPEEPSPASEYKPREEWFWFKRLSHRPEPFPESPFSADLVDLKEDALKSLRGKTPAEVDAVADRLAERGPEAIPLLKEFLLSEDRTVRWATVLALGRMKRKESLSSLLGSLRDEWNALAIMATSYVEAFTEPWIIPRLIKTVGPFPVDYNPHVVVRVKAAGILIGMGNYGAVPFLIKLLRENTPAAVSEPDREWAPTTRLAWEKEETLTILKRLTGTDFGFSVDGSRIRQAESALKFEAWWEANQDRLWQEAPRLDDPLLARTIRSIVQGLSSFQARNVDGARYCLKMLGPPVFPYLAEALASNNFYERFHALEIIAELKPHSEDQVQAWSKAVAAALKDQAPAVRMKAAAALGHLGHRSCLPSLDKALADPDHDVCLRAVDALGRIGGKDAEKRLVALLAESLSAQMEVEVKAALVRIAPEHADSYLEVFLSDDAKEQDYALQKLIDLLGEDFGFLIGSPPEERRMAVGRIQAGLETLH
jgi:HEAT repeat protein